MKHKKHPSAPYTLPLKLPSHTLFKGFFFKKLSWHKIDESIVPLELVLEVQCAI